MFLIDPIEGRDRPLPSLDGNSAPFTDGVIGFFSRRKGAAAKTVIHMRSDSGTQSNGTRRTIIVAPEAGEVLNAFGDTVQVKLTGEETNNNLAVGLGSTPPGHGPPPHVHHREDELFIILEGTFRYLENDGWSESVGPGGLVYTPRGVRHTFQNCGTTVGKHWVLATPSGFEKFFSQCAEVFARGGAPDMQRILAICAEHELEFVPPLMPGP